MKKITLANSKIEVTPLCLGANVFGWTSDESESFEVLDGYFAAGGNFIDTADIYSEWAQGNKGGESETIIGKWFQTNGNRKSIVLATKVAKLSTRLGLSYKNIKAAVNDSLNRLQSNYIDLYWAHEDDPKTPLLETLTAFNELLKEGTIKAFGASNYSASRIKEAHEIARSNQLQSFTAIQNEYNLVSRKEYENEFGTKAIELKLDQIPYYALASGFLTGKYRKGVSVDSTRAKDVAKYLTPDGYRLMESVERIASEHNSNPSAIALAWLRSKNCIPIASARTREQLPAILDLPVLSSEEVSELEQLSINF